MILSEKYHIITGERRIDGDGCAVVDDNITDEVIQLEAENETLRDGLQVLGGSPRDMLEYCQEHGLLPEPKPDGKLPPEASVSDYWRKAVVDALLTGGDFEINCARPIAHRIRILKKEHETKIAGLRKYGSILRAMAICHSEENIYRKPVDAWDALLEEQD